MEAGQDPYRTLQVDPTADDAVIQAAYRALMKRHHPDRGGRSAIAQALNAAYAAVGDPAARQAYDRSRRLREGAPPHREPSVASRAEPSPAAALSLEAVLGPELLRRFVPVRAGGPGWLFDFSGTLRESPRHRIWMKRFSRCDTADARAFLTMVEATRLARPIWRLGSDLFVAVLPGMPDRFEPILRARAAPFLLLGHAIAALDLTTRKVHTLPRGHRFPTVRALTTALSLPH